MSTHRIDISGLRFGVRLREGAGLIVAALAGLAMWAFFWEIFKIALAVALLAAAILCLVHAVAVALGELTRDRETE